LIKDGGYTSESELRQLPLHTVLRRVKQLKKWEKDNEHRMICPLLKTGKK